MAFFAQDTASFGKSLIMINRWVFFKKNRQFSAEYSLKIVIITSTASSQERKKNVSARDLKAG
jgi:hypothetical protein